MRRVLPLLLVALALALAACVSAPPNNEPVNAPPVVVQNLTPAPANAAPPPPDSACAGAANILQKDDCYLQLSIRARDVSWCDRIYSTATRDDCLNPFAATDAALCERLVDSNLRQDCYEQAARRLNATDYCVKLADAARKLNCLKALSPPCSFEKDNTATQLCRALQKSDYTLCQSNGCFFQYALARNSTDACALISGERALQLSCTALVTNEPNRCNDDSRQTISDYCLQIGAYARNSSSWCDIADLGSPYRNDCYAHFAIVTGNPSYYCAKAYPESSADDCYLNYSITTDSPAVCQNVVNTLNRNRCLIYTARNNGDPSACNALLYSDLKSCYNIVLTGSVPIGSGAQCAAVNDTLWHDKCFLAFAQQTSDITQCAQISDQAVAATCRSRLS